MDSKYPQMVVTHCFGPIWEGSWANWQRGWPQSNVAQLWHLAGVCPKTQTNKTHMFHKITNFHHLGPILTKFPALGAQT